MEGYPGTLELHLRLPLTKSGKSEPGRSVIQSILCFQFDTLTMETSSTEETSSPGIQKEQI